MVKRDDVVRKPVAVVDSVSIPVIAVRLAASLPRPAADLRGTVHTLGYVFDTHQHVQFECYGLISSPRVRATKPSFA